MVTTRSRASPVVAGDIPAYFLYGEPPRAPDARTVHIETIAARSRLHDWKISEHRHRDLYQVLLVRRGPVSVWVDGKYTPGRGPMLAVLPPGAVHGFAFRSDTDGFVVTFSSAVARDIMHVTSDLADWLDRPAAIVIGRRVFALTDLHAVAAMMLREAGRSAHGRGTVLQGLLAAFLVNALRLTHDQATTGEGGPERARALVARFRHAIEQHLRGHLSIRSYARTLRCSEAGLRRACRSVAGQPPIELVHLRLLVEAQRQLLYTNLTVTQIAYYLGFDDPAYFSRFFTKRMNLSPRAFRDASPRT